MLLEDKVAVVTGGARAMGRVIANQLAEQGAEVAVLAVEQNLLEETRIELHRHGKRALAIPCDVASESNIHEAISTVLEEFGRIDILVNNAGVAGPTAAVHQVDRQQWDEVLAINLTGAFICCKAVLPSMIERQSGRIINISSMAGRTAFPLRSPYATSKWGLVGLTLCLAKEVGINGIQVNAICPGPVEGERINQVIANKAKELGKPIEEIHSEFVNATALKRMVSQQDIANMVVYLASPAGAAITGQALEVSAGYGL